MKKVGQVLKETRLKKDLTLVQIEAQTKIRQKTLSYIEEGEYNKLPAPTYVKGLIKNYGEFLQLPTSFLLALYRREVKADQILSGNTPKLPVGFLGKIHLTQNLTITTITALILLFAIGYLFSQYLSISATPQLEINSPKENQIIDSDLITISGKSDPYATVFINNERINLNQQGEFAIDYILVDGTNKIEVTAVSKLGKQKKIIRTITKGQVP